MFVHRNLIRPSTDFVRCSPKYVPDILYYKRYIVVVMESEANQFRLDLPFHVILCNQCAVRMDGNTIRQITNTYFGQIDNLFPYGFPYNTPDKNMIKPFINRLAKVTITGYAPIVMEYEREQLSSVINFYDFVGNAYDDVLVMMSDNYVSPRYYNQKHEHMVTGLVARYPSLTIQERIEMAESMRGSIYENMPIQRLHMNPGLILDQFTLNELIDDRTIFIVDRVKANLAEDPYMNQIISRKVMGEMLCSTPYNSIKFDVKIGSDWEISPIEYSSHHKLYDQDSFNDGPVGDCDIIGRMLEELEKQIVQGYLDDIIPGPLQHIFIYQTFYGLICHLIIYRNGRNERVEINLSRIDQHNMLISDDVY